jgi:diguanylate cyclase (GGDEF)-like protein
MSLIKNNVFKKYFLKIYSDSSYLIQRRAYALLYFLVLVVIIIPVFFYRLYAVKELRYFELYFSFVTIEFASIISLLLLQKGKYNAAANLLLLSLLFSLLTVLIITPIRLIQTGNENFLLMLLYNRYMYPVIIVIAMMFCRKRWIISISIILIVSTAALYLVMDYNYNMSSSEFDTSLSFSVTAFIIISIISILSRKVTDEAHEKLENYIINLEKIVESRTRDLKSALDEKESINAVLLEKTVELKKLKESAETQARTDILTGLHNRLSFLEYSRQEINRSLRYGHPLSLIMADIDHFKSINDTYGHAEGDNALKNVAKIIVQCLRDNDFPARIGGEEFAIILPEANFEDASHIAERIRVIIEKTASVEGRPLTCSFGVGFLHENDISIDSILARTDTALYYAKNNGRNRVEIERRDAKIMD